MNNLFQASFFSLIVAVALVGAVLGLTPSTVAACSPVPVASVLDTPSPREAYTPAEVGLAVGLSVLDAGFLLTNISLKASARGGIPFGLSIAQRIWGYLHGTVGTALLFAALGEGNGGACSSSLSRHGRLVGWGVGLHALAGGLISLGHISLRRVAIVPSVGSAEGGLRFGLGGRF